MANSLKVSSLLTHDPVVSIASLSAHSGTSTETDLHIATPVVFEEVYRDWAPEVMRWVRALGGLDADLDDLTQEIFLVVERKLHRFDGQNLPGWLYRIAANTVSDYRRRAWFRRWLLHSHDALGEIASESLNPQELLVQKEAWGSLERVLDGMSLKLRAAFILFEVEGYSGEEIAHLERIPVATVWTRLHLARKEVLGRVAKLEARSR